MDSNPPSSRPNSESPMLQHTQLSLSGKAGGGIGGLSLPMGIGIGLGNPMGGSSKGGKSFPRVDFEPIYEALKSAMLIEQFAVYKETLAAFLTGRINRSEMMDKIQPMINDNHKQRLHNQLLLTMYTNSFRASPPPGPAPFVSSTGISSTSASKPLAQATEQRIKSEVMSLPSKDRKRIKALPLSPPPSPPQAAIQPPMGVPKPDIQIFSLPPHEFPDNDSIKMRMNALIYDNGLRPTLSHETVNFVTLAAEIFVKEVIGNVLERVKRRKRLIVPNSPTTNSTVHAMSDKENPWKRKKTGPSTGVGAGKRPAGRKPVQYNIPEGPGFPHNVDEADFDKYITMDDIRLSVTLGENLIAQLPLATARIMIGAGGYGESDYWTTNEEGKVIGVKEEWKGTLIVPNDSGKLGREDEMEIEDDEELGWEGGSKKDRADLKGILESVLSSVG